MRRVLIEPLAADGLVRARGVTVEQQAALVERLVERLAYLDEPLLVALREAVLRLAEGPLRNQWPAFVTVWNHAVALQAPPDPEIVRSWLGSREGPRLQREGCLVEVRAWLRRHGKPPLAYDMRGIRDRAVDNRRRFERLLYTMASGACSDEDRLWADAYAAALTECEAMVEQGCARRAAGVAA